MDEPRFIDMLTKTVIILKYLRNILKQGCYNWGIRLIFLDLTEQCRKTLRLVFFEKQCYKRIGEMLGIAEGTVKSRVSRCLEKAIALRERFAE